MMKRRTEGLPVRKFRLIWFVFTRPTERMEFIMALENFKAAAASLDAAADRLIAKNSADEAALAQANTELAAVDAAATAEIQPTLDKVNAAAPSPQ